MKICRLALSMLLLTIGISPASPYGPDGRTTEYQQPAGPRLTLHVFGDQYQARTETIEGYTVALNEADQCYYYVRAAADGGSLESTGVKAGEAVPAGLRKHESLSRVVAREIARNNRAKFDAERQRQWQERIDARRNIRERATGMRPAAAPGDGVAAAQVAQENVQAAPVTGGKVGLTILVQFPDDAATPAADPVNFPTDQAKIQRYCNNVNYAEDGNAGSVRDYFFQQSNSLLTYTQSVTTIVTLPNSRSFYNYSDYPDNATLRDSGETGRLVIQHAIAALQASGYDFSNLSVDGSNRVIATSVLFAGADSGVWSEGLWPHSWSMSGNGINVGTAQNPRYVYRYQITNTPNASPSIGTFCHENGHMLLGFPDLYDTGYESSGLGSHCLMSGGNHNNGGRTPAPINLYLKDTVAWANIVDLTATQSVTTSLPTTGNVGRRIRKPGTNTEYFLVENRGTGDKWAANVPDKGICIWHVDEAKGGNNEEQMTAAQHYEVSLEQADGAFDLENDRNSGDAQDLFDSGRPDFSDTTAPDAHWWDGTNSGVKVHVTSAAGANMNVSFGDALPANTLAILKPNGGESIYQGAAVPVTWNSSITGNVKIELLKNNVVDSVLSASEPNSGSYTWTVSAAQATGTDYKLRISSVDNPAYLDVSDATFEIKTPPTLLDALDTGGLVWTTGGTANWFPQTTTTHDGMDAAQSGDIGNNQSSYVQTTVTGPANLSFWWKVSSESGYDYLRFYLDGVEQSGSLAKISGVVDWTQKTVAIPTGSHTVKWEYKKDITDDANADTAWLDQVVIGQPDIAVEQPVGTELVDGTASISFGTTDVGVSAVTRVITIRNTGTVDLTGLAVTKDGAQSGDFTMGALGAVTLAPGASTTFSVGFVPSGTGTRNAALHIASNDADESPFDIALTGEGVGVAIDSATWTNVAGGSWPVGTNWLNGVIGNGSVMTAHFETLNLASNATVILDGARSIGGLVFGDTGNQYSWTLAPGSSGTLTLDAGGGSPLVTVNNQTTTLNVVLAGSEGLTKEGSGTLVLTGPNTYTGTTKINAGMLASTFSATQNSIGTGPAVIAAAATLQLNNTSITGTSTIPNTFTGTGTLTLNFAVGATARNTVMAGITGFNGTINLTSAGTTGDKWNASAGINAPNVSLVLSSGSQLYVVTMPSTFASVRLIGTGNNETRGAIRLGGTLNAPISLAGDTTIGTEGGILNGNITSGTASPAALTFGTTNSTGNAILNGAIGGGSGTLSLVKTAAGTVTLTKASTYSGGTTVSDGVLSLGTGGTGANTSSVNALGTGAVTLNTGGTVRLWLQNSTSFSIPNNFTLNGGTLLNEDGIYTLPGTLSLGASGGTLTATWSGKTLTSTGVISGSGVLNIGQGTSSTTGGTVILSGANTYSGKTSILGATLSVGSLNSVSGGAANSNLGKPTTVANGTLAIGTTTATGGLIYTGTGETTDRVLNLAGTTGGATITQSGTGLLKFTSSLTATGVGSKTLTLSGSTAGTGEISGVIVDNSATNKTSVSKSGSGKWTLAGGNTYTGGTTISAGILQIGNGGAGGTPGTGAITNNAQLVFNRDATADLIVANAISGSGTVTQNGSGKIFLTGANSYVGGTVVNTGTLGGTGSSGSALSVAAPGTLAPGNGIGTWSAASATFVSGSTFKAEINSQTSTSDRLSATGAVNLGGATLSLTDLASTVLAKGAKLTLVDYTGGTRAGTFAGLAEGATVTVGSNTFNIRYADGSKVTLTAVGYASWAASNAAGGAANVDFDKDGVPNAVEYFMGQTGTGFTATPKPVNGVITWPKDPTANATYSVQTSPDLNTWTDVASTDNSTSVSYTLPTGKHALYVRLKVVVP